MLNERSTIFHCQADEQSTAENIDDLPRYISM